MRIVMKFGGTAIDSPDKVNHVANLIKMYKRNGDNEIISVVSAVRGMTDAILAISNSIKRGDKVSIDNFIKRTRDIHTTIVEKSSS